MYLLVVFFQVPFAAFFGLVVSPPLYYLFGDAHVVSALPAAFPAGVSLLLTRFSVLL